MGCGGALAVLRRCKSLEDSGEEGSRLARCLGLLDLTALAVGSTLGLGVYVLAGAVAKTVAGPAVVLSFVVAAVASAFAGICYAEFAARVPKAGSAYVYSYVSVGEFVAFTIGWNLVLEYVIGTASMAKGMANYIDSLLGGRLARVMTDTAPIRVPFLADYPDFFAFGLVALITVMLGIGVKESTKLNNVLTALNLVTVGIVIVAGATKSDPANWRIKPEDIPEEYRAAAGAGGFMPFGLAGVMAGAAKCFFGFVGFDCVATCGEEAKNPKRDIPLSIAMSLFIVFVSYFTIGLVLTMMWPYYLQDADAPFPHVFAEAGLYTIKWIVTIGAIFALCTSLLGAMFPLPRVLYAMGSDGVLFRPLARIHKRTQTPLLATVIAGLFAATMATVFNLHQLIDMMSIGTLLAYTIVATSVLVLRYEEESPLRAQDMKAPAETPFSVILQTFNLRGLKTPTTLSSTIAKITIFLYLLVSLVTCFLVQSDTGADPGGAGVVGAIGGVLLLLMLLVLYRQPRQTADHVPFTVPLVPLLPLLSVFMNVFLMAQLDVQTWVRFVIWLAIGYTIYFCYGVRSSTLNQPPAPEKEKQTTTKF